MPFAPSKIALSRDPVPVLIRRCAVCSMLLCELIRPLLKVKKPTQSNAPFSVSPLFIELTDLVEIKYMQNCLDRASGGTLLYQGLNRFQRNTLRASLG
ncbi:hypothetical protein M378DRAFT_155528 [Amanita muscaria Koide BX008]|uniref:Uncharacterized protein n=1 Tax=Amanita muscaria (strain Koide BX008) TaxID=946122 RepID=A0A0C2XM38_AMAMK|nr:hypothetical protein M378DRAFT_155528 [Amanita muscaria Koide BX008]